ncbi:MAG: protein kinase [Hyphomicrobiaceae bacterium]
MEIDGWRAIEPLAAIGPSERYLVERTDGGRRGMLTLYARGVEPDPDVYEKLRQSRLEQVAEVLAVGQWEQRPYEVVEHIDGLSLRDLPLGPNDKDTLRNVIEAVGRALDGFARIGLRHRDLRPEVIQLRDANPASLVVNGFGAARLSEFDLDMVSPGETTRYMAPEAVLGGVAPASDWWSLGIILLEKLTAGACFDGVDDRAFLIHTLTQGVPLPETLDPDMALLLRGLLARDRARRWQWQEVRAWLDGERNRRRQ